MAPSMVTRLDHSARLRRASLEICADESGDAHTAVAATAPHCTRTEVFCEPRGSLHDSRCRSSRWSFYPLHPCPAGCEPHKCAGTVVPYDSRIVSESGAQSTDSDTRALRGPCRARWLSGARRSCCGFEYSVLSGDMPLSH